MRKWIRIMVPVVLISASLSACATVRQEYRKELSDNPQLEDANRSYKKALRFIREGDNVPSAGRAVQFYAVAESYLSDAIYKLKKADYENRIDVSEEVAFCEKVQRETHVKKGEAQKVLQR